MAVKRQYVINQFEPPALPPAWNRDPDARRFYTRLMEVLERLYNRSLGEAQIKRGSITADKLAPGIIDEYVLGPDAVDTVNIKNRAVTSAKIDDSAVATVNIRAGAVTNEKLAGTVPIQMDLSQNTSLHAITDPMDTALNDQTTGLVGRMSTVEQTLNDNTTGLVGRMSSAETRIDNAESDVSSLDTTVNATDTGLVDQVSSLNDVTATMIEDLYTATTGIMDRLADAIARIEALERGGA